MSEQGVIKENAFAPLKLVIISSQWPGLNPGGGISRPTAELATRLEHAGHEVTVVLTRTGNQLSAKEREVWHRVNIVELNRSTVFEVFPWFLHDQVEVADTIRRLSPDIVIAQEWQGLASLISVQSPRPRLITWCHGGSLYDHDGNNSYFSDVFGVIDAEFERIQIENSDALVSPSHFLLETYENHYRYKTPQSKTIPLHFPLQQPPQTGKNADGVTLLFAGRLTRRKGVDRFIKVARSAKRHLSKVNVLIAGESIDFDGEAVAHELRRAGVEATYLGLLDHEELWRVALSRNAVLAVTSSLDNSPNTIYEATSAGLRTLIVGTRNGGAELSDVSPLVRSFEDPESIAWEELLSELNEPVSSVSLENVNEETTQKWCDLFREITHDQNSIEDVKHPPEIPTHSITVVIPTLNRPDLLHQCLISVNAQTFLPAEVIVVDDASTIGSVTTVVESTAWNFPVRILRNSEQAGPGFSRNLGTKAAQSRFIAFLDDDNQLLPEHLEMCISAIQSGADIAVASLLAEKSLAKPTPSRLARRVVFLGHEGLRVSFGINLVGDTSFLCRRDDLLETGGFPERLDLAAEDFLLLRKMAGEQKVIRLVPQPTVRYRESETGVNFHGLNNFQTQFQLDQSNYGGHSLASFAARQMITGTVVQQKHDRIASIIKQILRKNLKIYGIVAPRYRRFRSWQRRFIELRS